MPNIVHDCLGMEFELSTPKVTLDFGKGPVEEGIIKGVSLGKILDEKVDVTLDPRTGFTGQGEETVVIELVLNHEFFPVEGLKNFGAELAQEIDQLDINNYLQPSTPYKTHDGKEIKATVSSKSKKVDLMVHVTCSCPLGVIYNTDYINLEDGMMDTADYKLTSAKIDEIQYKEIMCFVFLIRQMIEGIDPSKASKSDPKQKMSVMNRTSFGAIFAKFDKPLQPIIIDALSGLSYFSTMQISEKAGTIGEFYKYLINLKDGIKEVSDDPTYVANIMGEKLSISALGDTFSENEHWPIFEFRSCGTVSKSQLVPYIQFVLEELGRRKDSYVTFSTNPALWGK